MLYDELDGRIGVEWEGGSQGRAIYVYILDVYLSISQVFGTIINGI